MHKNKKNRGPEPSLNLYQANQPPWFPASRRVYNKLIDFMRSEYRLRGFHEVVTPNMYDARLFLTSGHYQNYKVLGVTFKKGDGWDDFL